MITHEAHWELPSDPQAIGKGREMARDTLVRWGLARVVDEVLVIISELCTNAVRHGGPPITLTLQCSGHCLGGEVVDRGPGVVPAPRLPLDDDVADHVPFEAVPVEALAESGRGLLLVDALADRWGVDPVDSGTGKAVWFRKNLCDGETQ